MAAVALVAAYAASVAGLNAYGQPSAEYDPNDEAITYDIASPAGTLLATKHYPPAGHDTYVLAVEQLGQSARLKGRVNWPRLSRIGLGKQDGVLLSWDGDTHLTVAGPLGRAVPSGPDHLGDVQVSYAQYARGKLDGHGPHSSAVTLSEVTYSVDQIVPDFYNTGPTATCILHAEGWDDRFHRLARFDVMAHGTGNHHLPNPMLVGLPAHVLFAATYLPDAVERPTLTQGMLDGFAMNFDPDYGLRGPIQDDIRIEAPRGGGRGRAGNLIRQTVLYEGVSYPREIVRIFDLLRDGRFEAVFEFGLGAQVVTYRFAAPVPRPVAEQFAVCEAATTIERNPSALSQHLLLDNTQEKR